jgi:hypothetical protein
MEKAVNTHQATTAYCYALSQLFSPSLLNKIHSPSGEKDIKGLINDCRLFPENESWNLISGLEKTYNYLKDHYRCEYVYKNEIANQLLLKFHSDNSATLLKEVNSNSCIADIVIINGKTVAYEIKTELDSFNRLANQIEKYQSLYDLLYVVTHSKAVKTLRERLDKNIGILVLDNNGIIKEEREASDNYNIFDPSKAVFTLRQSELVKAYERYISKLPKMGTALIYTFCYDWFLNLDREDAHAIFAECLKSRKPATYQFELIKKCSPALRMLFLGRDFSKKYCLETIEKLCKFG